MESARIEPDAALEFDLGNLCAFDPSPLDESQLRADPDGVLAQLPPPTTALPRHKPLPKPREPTKWEKFAQQKGIDKKQKRSKLVYDEGEKEWRRRYGYKRANDPAEIPIIEAKAGEEPGEDPFTKQREEKREGVKAQEKRQLANAKASAKAGAPPSTLRLAATLPSKGKGKPNKRRELADDVRSASRQAGVSTASMGKFDQRLALEKPGSSLA
ncbi:hypothetical protein WJX73_008233 [Symbiochloris irregularis]|uniref:Ribosome biogenesis regulatory protein n=1 Tax=Symbiochloris irregularis TaxID=706552 RepID=A0AAW1PMC7_9CHLO